MKKVVLKVYDNGSLLNYLIDTSMEEVKEIIEEKKLSQNSSFIKCLIDEFNYQINKSIVDSGIIERLRTIDNLL